MLLYIMLAYVMLFTALLSAVCFYNACLFIFFALESCIGIHRNVFGSHTLPLVY